MSDENDKLDWRIQLLSGGHVDLFKLLRPFADRIERLESDLHEARNMKYCGTWRNAGIYNRGNFCTHSGSLWIAERTTDAKPGTPDSGWKMVAKGGR